MKQTYKIRVTASILHKCVYRYNNILLYQEKVELSLLGLRM